MDPLVAVSQNKTTNLPLPVELLWNNRSAFFYNLVCKLFVLLVLLLLILLVNLFLTNSSHR